MCAGLFLPDNRGLGKKKARMTDEDASLRCHDTVPKTTFRVKRTHEIGSKGDFCKTDKTKLKFPLTSCATDAEGAEPEVRHKLGRKLYS